MDIFKKERQLTPSWDLVKPSIEFIKKYFWEVIYLSFVPGLLLFMGLTLIGEDPTKTPEARLGIGALIAFIGLIWAMVSYPAFIYLQAKAAEGKQVTAKASFRKAIRRLPALLGTGILGGILVMLGLVALIIPGLLLIRGFFLAPYYVVDQNLGPIEALKKSYADSVPVSAWIWGLIGVQTVFGIIASLLGKISAVGPILSIAASYIYVFAPAIRYAEITKKAKKPKTAK